LQALLHALGQLPILGTIRLLPLDLREVLLGQTEALVLWRLLLAFVRGKGERVALAAQIAVVLLILAGDLLVVLLGTTLLLWQWCSTGCWAGFSRFSAFFDWLSFCCCCGNL